MINLQRLIEQAQRFWDNLDTRTKDEIRSILEATSPINPAGPAFAMVPTVANIGKFRKLFGTNLINKFLEFYPAYKGTTSKIVPYFDAEDVYRMLEPVDIAEAFLRTRYPKQTSFILDKQGVPVLHRALPPDDVAQFWVAPPPVNQPEILVDPKRFHTYDAPTQAGILMHEINHALDRLRRNLAQVVMREMRKFPYHYRPHEIRAFKAEETARKAFEKARDLATQSKSDYDFIVEAIKEALKNP